MNHVLEVVVLVTDAVDLIDGDVTSSHESQEYDDHGVLGDREYHCQQNDMDNLDDL